MSRQIAELQYALSRHRVQDAQDDDASVGGERAPIIGIEGNDGVEDRSGSSTPFAREWPTDPASGRHQEESDSEGDDDDGDGTLRDLPWATRDLIRAIQQADIVEPPRIGDQSDRRRDTPYPSVDDLNEPEHGDWLARGEDTPPYSRSRGVDEANNAASNPYDHIRHSQRRERPWYEVPSATRERERPEATSYHPRIV